MCISEQILFRHQKEVYCRSVSALSTFFLSRPTPKKTLVVDLEAHLLRASLHNFSANRSPISGENTVSAWLCGASTQKGEDTVIDGNEHLRMQAGTGLT